MAARTFSLGRGGASVVKEYEIITLKYNGKACRLYLLFFCAPENIILYAIRPAKYFILADDLHLQFFESISPKASVENSAAQWAIF